MSPFFADEAITLWHGNCLELTDWLDCDVLVTDPPYGVAWRNKGGLKSPGRRARSRITPGIAGDDDTSVRDEVLAAWGDRPALVFGSPTLPPPPGTRQVLFYQKPPDAGVRNATAGFRRDVEAIYLIGRWPMGIGGRGSVICTAATNVGTQYGIAAQVDHPHAKPVDVMEQLLVACPGGVIADPFAGAGSTLVAARNLGRLATGVEIELRHCRTVAKRLAQDVLPIGSS